MVARSNRYKGDISHERSPPIPPNPSTSYNGCGATPSPYFPLPYGGEYAATRAPSSPPSSDKITTGYRGVPFIFLIILAQAVAFIFFYDMPTKLGDYNETMARMRVQQDGMRREAKHLESERIALWGESNRLEKERSALESSTLKMEGERDALESAIRRSEQERSRLDRQKQLMEDERHLLEHEREALREERGRWEKAREDRVPQGAFWDGVLPALDCRAYGKREYWGILREI